MIDQWQQERYEAVRRQWPDLFENPPNAAFTILFESHLMAAAEAEEATRLGCRDLPSSWSHTGVVYEDPYVIVVRDAVRHPDGHLGTYVRMLPASGAAGSVVLPLLDGQIVLLRHFRHATRDWHLEVPRGFGEAGMSGIDQARLELREEIGVEVDADALINLGKFHTNTGLATDCVELFMVEIDELGTPQTKEGISDIEIHSPHQVAEFIRTGAISDSFTIGVFVRAWLSGLLPSSTTADPYSSGKAARGFPPS